jgi:tetratricopeptide (TPR) repeat protein/CHAT domain-containing protein
MIQMSDSRPKPNLITLIPLLFLAYLLILPYSGYAAPPSQETSEEKALMVSALTKIQEKSYDEAILLLQQLLATYPQGQNAEKARYFLALVYLSTKQYEPAVAELDTFLRQYPSSQYASDAQSSLLTSLQILGYNYSTQGDYAKAEEFYQRALSLAQAGGNLEQIGTILQGLGYVYDSQRRLDEALEIYHQALEVFRQLGDQERQVGLLYNLGQVYDYQQRYIEAEELFSQALKIARSAKNREGETLALNGLSQVYTAQKRFNEALELLQQNLALDREAGNKEFEAVTHGQIAFVYRDMNRLDEALAALQQALALSRELKNGESEHVYLSHIARIYRQQERYSEALETLQQVLAIDRELSNEHFEAITLADIGLVYEDMTRFDDALQTLNQALEIARRRNEDVNIVLSHLARVYRASYQYDQAREIYQQVLEIERATNNKASESLTLSNIGFTYEDQGRYAEALAVHQQALTLTRELQDRDREDIILTYIGSIYRAQSRYDEALATYQEALALHQEDNNRAEQAHTLNKIALVYEDQGRYDEALRNFELARAIYLELDDINTATSTLQNIGVLYNRQAQYDKALEIYEQVLTIRRQLGDRASERSALNGLGVTYRYLKRYDEAAATQQQALVIVRELEDKDDEGAVLTNLGIVYSDQAQHDQALEIFQEALQIHREINDRSEEARTLIALGDLYAAQKLADEALSAYQQALTIRHESGNPIDEVSALRKIAEIQQSQGQIDAALETYRKALNLLEDVRAAAGSDLSRAAFIAQNAQLYEEMVNLFYQQGRPEEAFLISERGRSRAFLDSLATGQIQLTDARSTELLTQEQAAYAQRKAIQDDLARARLFNPPNPELVAELEKRLDEAETAYNNIRTAIDSGDDQLAQLISGRNTVLGVEDIQALLPPETTLLSYFVLVDKTLVFMLRHDQFQLFALEVSQADLAQQIQNFRDFPTVTEAYPESLVTLYNWLIDPLQDELTTPHLAIIPHQVLHYLPFAALTDGQRYLIDDHVLTTLPSASALPFINQNIDPQATITSALVLGNPATAEPNLALLTFAGQEAETIADFYQSQPLLQAEATERALREQAGQLGILHLAAHGRYNKANPLYSFIALAPSRPPNQRLGDTLEIHQSTGDTLRKASTPPVEAAPFVEIIDEPDDGRLEVHEIYGLGLKQTDLVVLSACETLIGDLSAGDEVVGLTRAFFFAGTPSVIASLWSVDDQATGLLMTHFYRHLNNGLDKAEALRQAQIEVQADFPNPYYWSAFVLAGDGGQVGDIKPVDRATATPQSIPNEPQPEAKAEAPFAQVEVNGSVQAEPEAVPQPGGNCLLLLLPLAFLSLAFGLPRLTTN